MSDYKHPIIGVKQGASLGFAKTELRLCIPFSMLGADSFIYKAVWATADREKQDSVTLHGDTTLYLHIAIDEWPVVAASLRRLIDEADRVYRLDRPFDLQQQDAQGVPKP